MRMQHRHIHTRNFTTMPQNARVCEQHLPRATSAAVETSQNTRLTNKSSENMPCKHNIQCTSASTESKERLKEHPSPNFVPAPESEMMQP